MIKVNKFYPNKHFFEMSIEELKQLRIVRNDEEAKKYKQYLSICSPTHNMIINILYVIQIICCIAGIISLKKTKTAILLKLIDNVGLLLIQLYQSYMFMQSAKASKELFTIEHKNIENAKMISIFLVVLLIPIIIFNYITLYSKYL